MKKMNLRSMAAVALISLSIVACSDENMEENTTYYTTRATVTSDFGESLTLRTDGGNQLTVISEHPSYMPESGQRTVVTYSIDGGSNNVYNARLHSAYDLLTKEVVALTAENESAMGNDPVHLYDTWCAGGYLNVNFGFNTSGSVTHYVNLVENSLVENPNDGKIYLEFRHNAMGDSENYGKRGTVCYDLSPYKDGNKILTFVVKFTEHDGSTVIREMQYDFTNDTIVKTDDSEVGDGLYE